MKTALVTGSTQGIGRAIAARLVRDGFRVMVHCSRDLAKAERVRAEIGAHGAVVCDLSDRAQVAALHGQTGDVDVLVLNASVQYKQKWQDITDRELDTQLEVNVISTLHLMQAYYPAMKLVENIAKEVAPFGVTVNNVSPGAIATPRNAAVFEDAAARAQVEACIPLGRFGTPEECAGIVAFLAGEESAYITGADIKTDGGMSL